MKKLLLSGLFAMFCCAVYAQNVYDKIFFTEYVVNGPQKALEIGNNTGAPVNLNRLGFRVHFNAVASTAAPIPLVDAQSIQVLPADSVFVLYHSTTTTPNILPANMPNTLPGNRAGISLLFSGNDAIELLYKDDANVWHTADFFGAIGTNPGTEWVGGPLHTTGMSLSRKASVTIGLQQNPADFTAVLISQWKANYGGAIPASGMFETLGMHSFSPFFVNNPAKLTADVEKIVYPSTGTEYIPYNATSSANNPPPSNLSTNTLKNYPLAGEFSQYGGNKNNKLINTPPGFFKTFKDETTGKWSLVDPLGYEFFSYGINAVKNSPPNTMNLPEDLLDMHLNTMGGWSEHTLINTESETRKMPYTKSLFLLPNYDRKTTVPRVGSPTRNFTFYRIFGTDETHFRTWIQDEIANQLDEGIVNDPYLIGYFSDNELKDVFTTSALQYHLNSANYSSSDGVNNPTYIFVSNWYTSRGGTTPSSPSTAHATEFYNLFAEKYYKAVHDALAVLDPNHLILGSRLTYTERSMTGLFTAMGPYIDVFTLNYYWAWDPTSVVDNWTTYSNKPVIITEFGAQARDVLNANNGTANDPMATGTAVFLVNGQQDRANFLEHYGMELLKKENVVGFHWFKYLDVDIDNKTGMQVADWINRGLVDKNYKPYLPLKKTIDKLGRDIYNLRNVKLGANINQTLAFTALPAAVDMGSPNLQLYAHASTDLPVTFSTPNNTYAEIVNGNELKIKTPGLVTITATQDGDATNKVNPATATQTLRIKTPQTIEFQNSSKFILDADFSPATASSGLPVTYISDDPLKAEVVDNGTKIRLRSAGTVNITAKQAGNGVYMAASDIERTLTISNTTTLSPEADAYVKSGSTASQNFGGSTVTVLAVKNDALAEYHRESYLRFNLNSLVGGSIVSAQLKMTSTVAATGTAYISALPVVVDNWGETTITFNNKPAPGTSAIDFKPVPSATVIFAVGSYIQDELVKDQKASFCLKDQIQDRKVLANFYSRETSNAANRPVLEVTVTKISGTPPPSSNYVYNASLALQPAIPSTNEEVIIYPNPASSHVTITASALHNGSVVNLYDTAGQLRQSGVIKDTKCELSIDNLAAGVYIVRIGNGATGVVRKIIKN